MRYKASAIRVKLLAICLLTIILAYTAFAHADIVTLFSNTAKIYVSSNIGQLVSEELRKYLNDLGQLLSNQKTYYNSPRTSELSPETLWAYLSEQEHYISSNDLTTSILFFRIVEYDFKLLDGTVMAKVTVTMLSKTLETITITCQLEVRDPRGELIYDNFLGEGCRWDFRETEVQNASCTLIEFEFPLPHLMKGMYIYRFTIWDQSRTFILDTTGWAVALLNTPPKLAEDLGTIGPNDEVSHSPLRYFLLYDLIKYEFTLEKAVKELTIELKATRGTSVVAYLSIGDLYAWSTLIVEFADPKWTIYNLPPGDYELTMIIESRDAYINHIHIRTSDELTAPSITIVSVKGMSDFADPGGSMSYCMTLEWEIVDDETVSVKAEMNGRTYPIEEFNVGPLSHKRREVHFTIPAPSEPGKYALSLTAELTSSGAADTFLTEMQVCYAEYNIAIEPGVSYYQSPSIWRFLIPFIDRSPRKVDKTALRALRVEDIKVSHVLKIDEEGNPIAVNITFTATNKISDKIAGMKFGDGVIYEVLVKDEKEDVVNFVDILLPGETRTLWTSVTVGAGGTVKMSIRYKASFIGNAIIVIANIVKPLVLALTKGLSALIPADIVDICKEIALYIWRLLVSKSHQFLTKEECIDFLLRLGFIKLDELIKARLIAERSISPATAALSIISTFSMKGYIRGGRLLKFILLFMFFLFAKAIRKLPDFFARAIKIVFEKLGIMKSIQEIFHEVVKFDVSKLLRVLFFVLSVITTSITIFRLLTAPLWEEKRIGEFIIEAGAPDKSIDPVVSLDFWGPLSQANITLSSPISSMRINLTALTKYSGVAKVELVVEPNATSVFLAHLSEPAFRRNLLNGFGLNATYTDIT